jgi:hypothetical protein
MGDITLRICKLIYAFEGELRGFGGTAACSILISSRTMSVQSREISHSLQKNAVYYTPSLPKKQEGAESCRFLDYDNSRTSIP